MNRESNRRIGEAMRILSILAQKPSSTGSGIYLTELLRNFHLMGEEQAVVFGLASGEELPVFSGVKSYPVWYESENLPFPVLGMSDEMPYKSTRYKDLTESMLEQFCTAFLTACRKAVEEFQPDLLLCHHLYLLTAMVREAFPDKMIYGFCHNTDLRQMEKHGLCRDYIIKQMQTLNRIYTPKEAQKEAVIRIYGVDPARIFNIAIGYNAERFHLPKEKQFFRDGIPRRTEILLPNGEKVEKGESTDLLFAGKLGEKKGIFSLLRAAGKLAGEGRKIRLFLAGDNGNQKEKEAVYALAESATYPIYFLGRLEQEVLAGFYQFSDIFVLPSFFDAVPLTALEALASGNKVVLSTLDGLEAFFREHCPTAPVFFAELPKMVHQDEMRKEDIPFFEENVQNAILSAMEYPYQKMADVSSLSWGSLCHKIVDNTAL